MTKSSEDPDSLQNFLERCENRSSLMRNKLSELQKLSQSVKKTTSTAKLNLDLHFESLKSTLLKALSDRVQHLNQNIDEVEQKDLEALNDYQEHLQGDLDNLNKVIEQAKNYENKENDVTSDEMEELQQTFTSLLKSYPDVPCASLSMTAKLDEIHLHNSLDQLKTCLEVSMTGNLQIVECTELPGAVLIRWDEQHFSDTESLTTDNSVLPEYILQYSPGITVQNENGQEIDCVFNTVYEGDEMSYVMTNMEANHMYTFRVCQRQNGTGVDGVCGPWSIPKKAWTTLPPHEWRSDDCTNDSSMTIYQLSNRNRTATKVFPESSRVLRSKSASYRLGHSLTFKIDEAGEGSSKDGIGLVAKSYEREPGKLLTMSSDAAVMNTRGVVFVNGSSMVTKLPALKRGSVITYEASRITAEKLRVSLSVEDREVTFDWCAENDVEELGFACGFEHSGWQITVSS